MLFGILVTLALLVFCGILVYLYFTWNFNCWKKRGLIGPKPKPIFGSYPSVFTRSRNIVYDINDIYNEYKNQSGCVGTFLTRNPQILVTDPVIAHKILSSDFKSFPNNQPSQWIQYSDEITLQLNPFMMTGDKWKEKRNDIIHGLTPLRIKVIYPIMLEVCDRMGKHLEHLTAQNKNNGVNLKDICSKFTLGVVASCVFGLESDAFEYEESVLYDMAVGLMKDILSVFMYFMTLSIFPLIHKVYKPPIIQPKHKEFFLGIMRKSIEMRKENKMDRTDFLNHVMELSEKKNFSEEELLSTFLTFFLDGFDTSSMALSHTLHMLAKHPEVQKRLREELLNATNKDGIIEFEELLELPYLNQCIQESLRMFPPGLFLMKSCTESTILTDSKDKSYQFHPDDTAVIPIFSFHYDKTFYDNPKEFNPDRFSPEKGGTKKYSDMGVFMPFGDGPRICLGRRFATALLKAGISNIVKNWDLTVNEKTSEEFEADPKEFLCTWKGGIFINFNKLK